LRRLEQPGRNARTHHIHRNPRLGQTGHGLTPLV